MRSRQVLAPHFFSLPSLGLGFWVGVGGVVVGTAAGLLAGVNSSYLVLAIGAVIAVVYFFADFERAVLGLLIVRTSLDVFSHTEGQEVIPSAFAIGIDALTLLYVSVLLLTGRTVRTDGFWWFFAGWMMLQGVWLILSAIGGLGLAPSDSILAGSQREWTRMFSWLMVYLLVMQLKYRFHPEKIISWLFLSLLLPLTAALMQTFLPLSLVPELIVDKNLYDGRIEGTFGHPNGFATYVLFFIGLTYWKLSQSRRRWPWVLLLGLLAFVFVGTKALFSLAMLGMFIVALMLPKLKLPNAIGGVILLVVVLSLFASSDFGRTRLGTLGDTPMFNPNLDVSRAVLKSHWDYNSFNWRLAQWTALLQSWQKSPILGYGLGTITYLSEYHLYAHDDYIRALAEEGIVGLITFLTFLGAQVVRLVKLLGRARRGSGQHELCLVLLAFFMSTLLAMCSENLWSHTTLYFYWWTMFAIAGWNWNELPPSKSPVPISPQPPNP